MGKGEEIFTEADLPRVMMTLEVSEDSADLGSSCQRLMCSRLSWQGPSWGRGRGGEGSPDLGQRGLCSHWIPVGCNQHSALDAHCGSTRWGVRGN